MSLFTVEQLELIRRLRATGMKIEQIVDAYRQLDIFEGVSTSNNVSVQKPESSKTHVARSAPSPQPPAQPTSSTDREPTPVSMQSAQKKAKKRPASNSHQTPVASKMRLSDDRPSVIDIESPPPAMASSLINEDTSHLNVGDITPRTDAARRFVAATTYLRSIPVDKIKGQQYKQFSDFEFEGLHIPEKLVELVKACNDKLRIEISDYFYTNNLKQGDIANLTGLSPSSISRVLNPNTKESVTMINIFIVFACYLDCISYPDLLEAYNSIKDGKQSSHRAHKSHKKFKTVDEVRNRLDNAAKKFEKHPILLAPLNTYFKETPTPDWSRAEEIAKSCNNILDDLANRGLSSSSYEAITPLDIYRLFEKTNQIRKEQFALDPEGKIHEFDDNYIQLVIKHYTEKSGKDEATSSNAVDQSFDSPCNLIEQAQLFLELYSKTDLQNTDIKPIL